MRVRNAAIVCLVTAALSARASADGFIPASVRYRDSGGHPSSGRSGSAALQMRALRGQAGTDIEVTTGAFDSPAPAPGRLDKIQAKVFGGDGHLVATENRTDLNGPTATLSDPFAERGQRVQVQANVRGNDASRTDVVTVDGIVMLRPDLRVAQLHHEAQARVDTSVSVAATIAESNGDLGAHGTCVLSVDGALADLVEGVWVDAGDSVTCQMTWTFTEPGVHQLAVNVVGVTPGDFDLTNNGASGQIEIVPGTLPVYHNAAAWSYHTEWSTNYESHLYAGPQSNSMDRGWIDRYDSWTTEQDQSGFSMQSLIERAVEFPVSVDLFFDSGETSVSESIEFAGPQTVSVIHGAEGDREQKCANGLVHATFIQVCTQVPLYDTDGWRLTGTSASRYDGTVTYRSTSLMEYRDLDGVLVVTYSYNYEDGYESGGSPKLAFGDSVSMRLVTSGDTSHEAAVDLALVPFAYEDDPPPVWTEGTGVDVWWTSMNDYRLVQSGKHGSAAGWQDQ